MDKKLYTVWQPQPKQRMALNCPADELFYGGAKGGGKSDFLLADFLTHLDYGAAHRGIMFRRTYDELAELQIRANEIYPELGGRYASGEKMWHFPKGATLRMRYLDRDQDVHHYQGHQYTWLGFDELTNWPRDKGYVWMFSCARSPHGVPVSIRASGNPGNVGHQWVKQRFIDGKIPMHMYYNAEQKMTSTFIPAKLEDNLILIMKDPQYETRLKALPPHLYRAYRNGDWDIFAGQAFEEYRRDKHVIHPIPLDPSWRRFCSFDWGYARPYSIGWWAVTNEGRLIRYREMYGCEPGKHDVGIKKAQSQLARESWNISVAEGCDTMVVDPSIFNKPGEAPTVAETFQAVGWNIIKGENDRKSGLARVHDYMKQTGPDGQPLLMVFDTCHAWIRTIPTLVVDEKNPEDLDTTGEDHAYDETRYAVMSKMALQPHVLKPVVDMGHMYGPAASQDYDPLRWEMG